MLKSSFYSRARQKIDFENVVKDLKGEATRRRVLEQKVETFKDLGYALGSLFAMVNEEIFRLMHDLLISELKEVPRDIARNEFLNEIAALSIEKVIFNSPDLSSSIYYEYSAGGYSSQPGLRLIDNFTIRPEKNDTSRRWNVTYYMSIDDVVWSAVSFVVESLLKNETVRGKFLANYLSNYSSNENVGSLKSVAQKIVRSIKSEILAYKNEIEDVLSYVVKRIYDSFRQRLDYKFAGGRKRIDFLAFSSRVGTNVYYSDTLGKFLFYLSWEAYSADEDASFLTMWDRDSFGEWFSGVIKEFESQGLTLKMYRSSYDKAFEEVFEVFRGDTVGNVLNELFSDWLDEVYNISRNLFVSDFSKGVATGGELAAEVLTATHNILKSWGTGKIKKNVRPDWDVLEGLKELAGISNAFLEEVESGLSHDRDFVKVVLNLVLRVTG